MAARSMESKEDLWQDTHTLPSISFSQPGSSVVKNLGSGEYSSQDGSLPSCSTTSSERNHSTGTTDGADDVGAMLRDDEVRAMLMDEDVRAMLKKVTVNEGVLNKAMQSLGGGEKGLKGLMGYIMLWVKQQRERKSSSPQQPLLPSNTLSNSSTSGDVTLQLNSDTFQCLSGFLQPPSTKQVSERDMYLIQRFKSRRLMMGEPEMGAGLENVDTGFCPSSFVSTPEAYKPEMASPGVLAPCIPQLNYGMPLQPPVMPFTNAHIGMPSVEQTPAMATRAARRHRMARQRQSSQSRAASHAATAPVSVGSGTSLNCAAPSTVKKSGTSGAQTTLQSSPGTVSRKSRNTESLTLLLQKELRTSDVGNLGRIILPKKEAEQHMPSLVMRGGMSIKMEDFDSGHIWNLRYSVTSPPQMGSSPLVTSGASSFWPNNKSRMYLLENTGDFVKSHRLVEGDLLLLYRSHRGDYVIRGKKKRIQRPDIAPVQVKFAHNLAEGSHTEPTSPKENGMLVQRLYGGGPPEKCVKDESAALDDDPFLKEMMLTMVPSLGSDSSCFHTLERFPSLNLDFHIEEIMAGTKSKPEG